MGRERPPLEYILNFAQWQLGAQSGGLEKFMFWFLEPLCYEISMRLMTSFSWITAGAILVIAGFAYDLLFAGLPYQDPSSEIQERWIFHKGVAESIMVAGVTVLGIGCIWKAFPWIMRLLGRQQSD